MSSLGKRGRCHGVIRKRSQSNLPSATTKFWKGSRRDHGRSARLRKSLAHTCSLGKEVRGEWYHDTGQISVSGASCIASHCPACQMVFLSCRVHRHSLHRLVLHKLADTSHLASILRVECIGKIPGARSIDKIFDLTAGVYCNFFNNVDGFDVEIEKERVQPLLHRAQGCSLPGEVGCPIENSTHMLHVF